ncbi:MAG: prepilin peptidase [Patescibacteria group bacterium]|nr:A24 family peptidase [Patescibacteria group bacterium]MDE2015026.1 prepilin peptidase [Patescibacteria group bacterium]MDE2226454.1 prepilin peptidase [Patescibacteria group bacterium]
MNIALLFIFGAAIGSFLNVVSVRYQPDKFLFSGKIIGGRSHCPNCKKTLRWFELVPLLSFMIQGGRCRRCGERLSFQYPAVEIVSGIFFVFVPQYLSSYYSLPITYYTLSVLWTLVFLTLLVVFLIDLRLSIIPDEANIILLALAILILVFGGGASFSGSYGTLFGFQGNVWLNHIFAAIIGGAFFGFLILATKGRGMGLGDLKLIIPLGFLFGWPDILFIMAAGFIIGAICGGYLILAYGKKLKSAVPFGPFLVASSVLIFFFGRTVLDNYFNWLLR